MARVVLRFESASQPLSPLPSSLADLQSKVSSLFNIQSFSILCGSSELTSTRDLLVAYLNSQEEVLTLTVDETIRPISFIDESLKALMNVMTSGPEPAADGILPFRRVTQLLDEVEVNAKRISRGVANSFQDERMRVYRRDNQQYRVIVFDQLRTLTLLQANTVGEVLRMHEVDPEVFRRSVDAHQADLQHRLDRQEDGPVSLALPADLDQVKFREMLEYSTSFTLGYLAERGALDQSEYAMLKVLEADEMYLKFGYRESDINLAFKEFDFEGSADWDDIKARLGQVRVAEV
jgi:hypothetical protein